MQARTYSKLFARFAAFSSSVSPGHAAFISHETIKPFSWQLMWVDGGYSGPDFAAWVQEHCSCRVEVVKKDPEQQGFAALPRRWVVERTFAWLGKCRRLSKDYEQKPQHSQTWIRLAMIQLMLRQL